jgi:hypothetical protein
VVDLNKVKLALVLVSIAIVVGPLAGMAFIYRDNLVGLVVPPEITNLEEGQVGDVTASNFVAPSLVGEPQYNPETGALDVSLSVTNPLDVQVSVEQFSADIRSKDSKIKLGNVALVSPIDIASGGNGIVDVAGNLSQELIDQIVSQYQDNGRVDIVVENVNAVVAGVEFHLDSFDVGSIQLSGVLP